MDLRETMKALCSECGPSGFEGKVASKARELIEPLCDETWIDRMGNVHPSFQLFANRKYIRRQMLAMLEAGVSGKFCLNRRPAHFPQAP